MKTSKISPLTRFTDIDAMNEIKYALPYGGEKINEHE